MAIMGVARFERFFRVAADLGVDKDDLKRYNEFVHHKLYDLLIIGQGTARANDRGIIMPFDLPITKGLQESMHRFNNLDEDVELQPILEHLATLPALDLLVNEETQARLPAVAGGLSVALATTFKIIDPKLRNPQTTHWERSFENLRSAVVGRVSDTPGQVPCRCSVDSTRPGTGLGFRLCFVPCLVSCSSMATRRVGAPR